MARVVERNIQELLRRRQAEDARRTWQEKLSDAVIAYAGSPTLVFIHLALSPGPVRRLVSVEPGLAGAQAL